jgi:hypothetical protein
MAMNFAFYSSASEYEVDGQLTQTINGLNGAKLHAAASFKVFVRGCGWLIETMETNELGAVIHREIGSTNGTEIYECEQGLGYMKSSGSLTNSSLSVGPVFRQSSMPMLAVMVSNNVPIGEADSAVVGHLWLIFASQCYWQNLRSDQLAPVYDWHASAAAHGLGIRVDAAWALLDGPGSLPREVRYLGDWGETNGLYQITGTNLVGGMMIPSGFTFEQFQIGPLNEKTFIHDMTLVKRVGVKVTSVRPGCSLASLIPAPEGPAVIVDRRFDSGIPNRPPSYQNPVKGQWPGIEQSRALAKVQQAKDLQVLNQVAQFRSQGGGQGQSKFSAHRSKVILIVMCIFIAIPPIFLLFLQRSKKS